MAQLKTSELSVGDWVCYDRDTDAVQIMGIYVHNNQECVVMSDSYYPDGVIGFVEYIKPIPLTPEILEKNGFGKNGAYNEWNIGEWYEKPFISVSLDRQSLRVKHFGNDIFIEGKELFVHQLQHAMRLAGVEKEIEL